MFAAIEVTTGSTAGDCRVNGVGSSKLPTPIST